VVILDYDDTILPTAFLDPKADDGDMESLSRKYHE